jgi:hypothetical protein
VHGNLPCARLLIGAKGRSLGARGSRRVRGLLSASKMGYTCPVQGVLIAARGTRRMQGLAVGNRYGSCVPAHVHGIASGLAPGPPVKQSFVPDNKGTTMQCGVLLVIKIGCVARAGLHRIQPWGCLIRHIYADVSDPLCLHVTLNCSFIRKHH